MLLNDTEIIKRLHELFPFHYEDMDVLTQVQPSSVDLRLGRRIKRHRDVLNPHQRVVDPQESDEEFWEEIDISEGYVLHPGPQHFILATTIEGLRIPPDITARVDGRSSYGRKCLKVHSTAGFIDPGFEGQITLEMDLSGRYPLMLRPGVRICQVSFQMMTGRATRPYGKARGSKYFGQRGVTSSRSHEDT